MRARGVVAGRVLLVLGGLSVSSLFAQSNWTVVGWNNLGMHCMDSDYGVFSILPPYNVIHAHVINGQGDLVTNAAGIGVAYHAVADLDGSINRTSRGKTTFWDHEDALFGLTLDEDEGLPVPGPGTWRMPGTNNLPQSMAFEPGMNWFAAYGIPIAPYDDKDKPNQYPMLRLLVTNASGQVLAMSDIVVPVSDEMDCKLCHASGSGPAAEPQAGWTWEAHPGRDYRLNILRLHDESGLTNPVFTAALAAKGFNPAGLYATAVADLQPILCASCHLSEALPGSGIDGIPPLTEAMHGLHEEVLDPRNGMTLGSAANREACYTCHPGSETRCLRGAMGRAVASDGSMLMQCQSCHGGMAEVGSPLRTGWLDEPNCQACHVGSATNRFGVIRFADAFADGVLRTNTEPMFATNPDTPPGHSLYRFSRGHGGLQCSACHGSTHAIYPTALPNDNLASIQNQGHAGTLNECAACHNTVPNTRNGGPHGMHTIGQAWIEDHNDAAQQLGVNACRRCHGQNGEGTVLSLAFSEKTVSSEKGTVHYWKGRKVTCWGCHDGMFESDPTSKATPVVSDVSSATTSGIPVAITLNGANLRIVDTPRHGRVGLAGTVATYYPDPGFSGTDTFTFAAHNGYNDSNLGTVTVRIADDPDAMPAPGASRFFAAAHPSDGSVRLGFESQLGDAYRVESTTNLTGDVVWDRDIPAVWGRTDATFVPDPAVVDFMRHFRVLTIDPPPVGLAAHDDGTESAYDGGWINGANGGEGFDGWTLSVSGGGSGGFFIAQTNAAFFDGDHRGWGLFANGGARAEAARDLPRPLGVGEGLALYFENNFVDSGARVGVDFLNASGALLAEFLFVGGQNVYRVDDRAGSRTTWIPWSDRGWNLVFRMAADGQYHLACNDHNVPGFIKSAPDMQVASVKVWNENAGSGSDHDLFVNDLRFLAP